MNYFAYASNLKKQQMKERAPESKPLFTTTLPNYKLVFSGWSRQWRGGSATIMHSRGDKVLGGVYEVSEQDLRRLDRYEDCPRSYSRLNASVFDEAIEPYEKLVEINAEREHIAKRLISIKAECDAILVEMERKFKA